MVRMERLTLAVCISSSGAMVMLVLKWIVSGPDVRVVFIVLVCSAVVTNYEGILLDQVAMLDSDFNCMELTKTWGLKPGATPLSHVHALSLLCTISYIFACECIQSITLLQFKTCIGRPLPCRNYSVTFLRAPISVEGWSLSR